MWTISASGPKDNVLNKIQNATPPVGTVDDVIAFRAAQAECRKQVEEMADGDEVALLASGSGEASTISVSKIEPPAPPKQIERKAESKSESKRETEGRERRKERE